MSEEKKKKSKPVEREVELVNSDRSKTGQRKKMSPERQQRHNNIIETVRQMLCENWTKGDIKRALKSQFQVGYRQAEEYLDLARKRNLEILDRSEDDVTSDSLRFWARKQRDCGERVMQAKKRIADAEREIERTRGVIEDFESSKEVKELAVEQLKVAVKQLEDARKTIYSAEMMSASYQDRIDRILSPGKYNRRENAQVTTEGKDVLNPAEQPEPINNDVQGRALDSLIDSLMSRGEPKVPDEQ